MWIVDFVDMAEEEASLYEAPFEYIKKHVLPIRSTNRRKRRGECWWQHAETVPGVRVAVENLSRFLATPNVSKHRLFVWLERETLPSNTLVAFAREDDYFFGVLQSTMHDLWARRHGGQVRDVGSGFRYTPTTR